MSLVGKEETLVRSSSQARAAAGTEGVMDGVLDGLCTNRRALQSAHILTGSSADIRPSV